ncbi:uncharacterized protein TNCV_3329961 [Trichonephila clavipes]|uniref:Uncharacterized protein n=1 Tax=Trichonephila inaurata madagascariensis TaxID=2747483 RepID=A0A8X6YIL7_9ARAC|nr:uncharacterized protein TNCV_3329961 [Trichonephila clavipes]GFY73630.1 uncharacterized protein TNIN_311801 [Trichonephila inaurata madagascariensis]
MKLLLVVLLGLISCFGYAFEMRINHDPWWRQDLSSNTVETSYQFQKFPCHKRNANSWSLGCKMFKTTPWPYAPLKKPRKMSEERRRAMMAREWPEWIPPIRMVKLPLDEPPAF